MQIRYLGHSCFEITSKAGKSIITDPYTKVGYELPKGLYADVVTTSHAHFDHNYTQAIDCNLIINEAKSYCIDGIEIVGIESYHDTERGALRGKNIIYNITIDGIVLCHMGDIGEACSQALVEKIGKVDVLLIPVGGRYTVDALEAKEYIDKINPKVVIPMHYKPHDGALDIAEIQPFLDIFEGQVITMVVVGSTEIDANTSGIIYMERVNQR